MNQLICNMSGAEQYRAVKSLIDAERCTVMASRLQPATVARIRLVCERYRDNNAPLNSIRPSAPAPQPEELFAGRGIRRQVWAALILAAAAAWTGIYLLVGEIAGLF